MKPIFALVVLVALSVPAHAQQTKEELRLMLEQQSKAPPPRGCMRTARGDLVPVPRSEGDDVDMDACKRQPEEKKVKSIFEVFSE